MQSLIIQTYHVDCIFTQFDYWNYCTINKLWSLNMHSHRKQPHAQISFDVYDDASLGSTE